MLIKLCNKPFLKEKTSDELNYVPKTVHLLNEICVILQHDCSTNDSLFYLFTESMIFLNEFSSFGVDEYKNQNCNNKC